MNLHDFSPLALSCAIFALIVGGIFLGVLLRRALPKHHLSKDSQDVVRLGVGPHRHHRGARARPV